MSATEPTETLTEAETELCVSACLMSGALIIAAGGENPARDQLQQIWPENASADSFDIGTQIVVAMAAAFDIDPAIIAELANQAAPKEFT